MVISASKKNLGKHGQQHAHYHKCSDCFCPVGLNWQAREGIITTTTHQGLGNLVILLFSARVQGAAQLPGTQSRISSALPSC